jgi:oligopeptide/dipeptide ABC transporter ATP-binding protein
MATRIQVLLHGRLVEGGTTEEVLSNPSHPYTKALISAELPPRPGRRGDLYRLKPAGADNPITGCPLVPACPLAIPDCSAAMPPMFEVSTTHTSACLRFEEVSRGTAAAKTAASGVERQSEASSDRMSERAGAPDRAPGGDRP